jgi:nucleotide-binding universal stress UspA family protein
VTTAGASFAQIVVGVDGSEASIEALRQAQRLGGPLGAKVLANAYWDCPQVYSVYMMMDVEGFEERAGQILDEAVRTAVGDETPSNTF